MTKTTPKGKTPSLISGTNGRPKRVAVSKKSNCYRCNDILLAGTDCIEIPKLGGAFSSGRRVCNDCYSGILVKTEEDLKELKKLCS
jgi:hypothetical protein